MGVNRGGRISVPFRTDVFRFLFKDKGTICQHGRGLYFELEHFNTEFFPAGWNKVLDRLGDGCEVQFPVRLHSHLRWGQTVYKEDGDGELKKKQKTYEEICTIWLIKQRM